MFPQIGPATTIPGGITPWDKYAWFRVMRPYTQQWVHNAYAAGGTLTYAEIRLAEDWLAQPIYQAGLESKIVALYPFIGDVNAARCPLHDLRGTLAAANCGLTKFTNSTLGTAALGLQCVTTSNTQYLSTNLTPNQVAGVVENVNPLTMGIFTALRSATLGTTFVEMIGCYADNTTNNRFSLDMRSNLQGFRCSAAGDGATLASTASNTSYHGEYSATNLRTLYKAGVSIATNTSATTTSGSQFIMTIGGCRTGASTVAGFGPATLPYAGFTTGNLGATAVATLDAILAKFCTAAGR
jgi:hypothetical protein